MPQAKRKVELLAAARRDVDQAIDHYRQTVGAGVAGRFARAVELAYRGITIRPGTGSPRYADIVGIDGLRHRPVKNFPYLVFYVEADRTLRVLRVLHARRDIDAELV